MAVDVQFKLTGIEQTLRKLAEFPEKVQKRCLRLAVSAGGTVLVKSVKANSPRMTGLFKRSITAKLKSYQGGAIAVSIVGQSSVVRSRKKLGIGTGGISGRGDIVPIHFLESGIKPHPIVRRGKGALLLLLDENAAFRRSVRHPGHRGFRMVECAVETAGAAAQARVEQKLQEEVEKLES